MLDFLPLVCTFRILEAVSGSQDAANVCTLKGMSDAEEHEGVRAHKRTPRKV